MTDTGREITALEGRADRSRDESRAVRRRQWQQRRGLAAVAAATAVVALGCGAQPRVPLALPEGTDQPIAEAERFGRIMLIHDAVAADATDELGRIGAAPSKETGVIGWITLPEAGGITVRFVGESDGHYTAVYDVSFATRAPVVKQWTPPQPLPSPQVAAFRARQTAIGAATLDCSDRYNTVVFQDPMAAGDDWYVYLLPATTVAGRVMVGRVLRFRISGDGTEILENTTLSKDCIHIDRSDKPPGATDRAIVITNLISPTPNESHVFINLHEGVPLAVATSLGTWWLVEGNINYLGPHQ